MGFEYFSRELVSEIQARPLVTSVVLAVLSSLFFFWLLFRGFVTSVARSRLPPPPQVPGLPVVGNLLQLKEKTPHKTFTRWAETYGPVFSIKTGASTLVVLSSTEVAKESGFERGSIKIGASTVVVLSSTEVAKEAMVTRFTSISTRKLSNALNILTSNKTMVATSDYNDFHKMAKKYILSSVLGASAQKQHRSLRDNLIENVSSKLHSLVDNNPSQAVNFRRAFEFELFTLALIEALGEDVKSIYVDELRDTLSKEDIYKILVTDLMAGAIEVDWRDFFPYLKWVPNNTVVNNIQKMDCRRKMVMRSLINQQRKRIASGERANGYVDFLLSEANLSDEQMIMLVWEPIIEASDTTLVTTEWAMYELAKDPICLNRLYEDIKKVCGSRKMREEDIPQLPFLTAVFHEILRYHGPVPIIPPRYAHEDTELGGYFVPAGSQIAINIYGCNMDKRQWESPEEFKPERFLDAKFEASDLYKTMAFGAGKRVCAGSLQAMLISCTSIGRLVQEFEWRLSDGEEENVDTVGLTTHRLHPLEAILNPRN